MPAPAPVVVVAPDSFKGSLDAPAVCAAIAEGLHRVWPQAEVIAMPIADGGEGTLDAVLAAVGDAGRRLHERVHGAAGDGERLLALVEQRAAILMAFEQVGGAQRCLDMAVEYAKVRVQFGRPIGSFQAIKHKCADMLLEVESAKSAAYYAAWCASEMNDELPSVASLAKAYCSDAYFHAAAENIQIHGGIGFTWEHPAHLYFKRAKSSELLFGDPTYHRELLAQRIGI